MWTHSESKSLLDLKGVNHYKVPMNWHLPEKLFLRQRVQLAGEHGGAKIFPLRRWWRPKHFGLSLLR